MNETNFGDGANALYSSTYYWVASRFAYCSSSFASFGVRRAGADIGGGIMFYSSNDAYNSYYRLRPVVSLGFNVQITVCEGANSTTNTHKIVQY